jgi:hypothetical protein
VRRELRGPPAGGQLHTAAAAGVSSSRAPGAPNAQPAASGALRQPHPPQPGSRRAGRLIFPLRGLNHIDPSANLPCLPACLPAGRAEPRVEASGDPSPALAAGALCSLKAAAEKVQPNWRQDRGERSHHSHAQSSG